MGIKATLNPMNEEIKQQKATELRNLVAELNQNLAETENAGLIVKLHLDRYDSSNARSSHYISCEIFERKDY